MAQIELINTEDAEERHRLSVVERAKEHVLEITGLLPGTSYSYALVVTDAIGNATQQTGQVRTIEEVLPPSIVEGPTRQRITEDRVWISFKTNVPTRAEISYYPEEAPGDLLVEKPSGRGKAHVVQLTNLLSDTPYRFAVVAIDDKAQLSSEVIEGSFRTEKGPDLVAPKLQGVPAVVSFSDTRAKIVWKTDEPADSRIDMHDVAIRRAFARYGRQRDGVEVFLADDASRPRCRSAAVCP